MTITLGAWAIPVTITALIIAWAFLRPLPGNGRDYDFSREAASVVRAAIVVVVTLIVWLGYFALK